MKPATCYVLFTVFVCCGSATVPAAKWDLSQPMNGFTFQRAKVLSRKTPDSITSRVSRLRNTKSNADQHITTPISLLGHASRKIPGRNSGLFQNISAVGEFSTQYAIECSWDGKAVWLSFSTSLADTWAAQTGFRCEDKLGNEHGVSSCGFGDTPIDDFGHGELEGIHFHISHGSGEDVSGPMGLSDISCGGLSVSEQQVGLANRTYWQGNNVSVGVLGLAYPALTSAFLGGEEDESDWNNYPYTPFLTKAIAQGSIDPVFSVSISRNSNDGILTWGGLPAVSWQYESFAATDLIVVGWIAV